MIKINGYTFANDTLAERYKELLHLCFNQGKIEALRPRVRIGTCGAQFVYTKNGQRVAEIPGHIYNNHKRLAILQERYPHYQFWGGV